LITDDPGTPGNKHWEINVAFTDSNFRYGSVVELPHVDLNYGYGDNVQLKLEGPFTIFKGPNGDDFSTLAYTNWGVKWRFQEENKQRPALSTYPQVLFVGNQKLAQLGVLDPGTDFYLPLEAMKSFGHFQIDGEVGLLFRQFVGTEFSYGVCAEYDATEKLALLGEIHDVTFSNYTKDELIWNLGFKYDFSAHQSLHFSAGRGFGPAGVDEPTFLTYIGIQFRA
jgi:outer membrane receptor protein involved in Fe transport